MWNPCDAAAIIFFVIGLTLRFRPNTMDAGRVIYCLDSIYWYLRILNILGVNKYLGQFTHFHFQSSTLTVFIFRLLHRNRTAGNKMRQRKFVDIIEMYLDSPMRSLFQVTMMGKMVKNMIYFVVLLLVVLLSFGVSRQAILFPHKDASWSLIKDVFFQPYFMLYGEVFADDIYPACGEDPGQMPCVTGTDFSDL